MGAAIPPGISRVVHDTSLSGNGSASSPLGVVGGDSAGPKAGIYTANGSEGVDNEDLDFTITLADLSPSITAPDNYIATVSCGGVQFPLTFDVKQADNGPTIHVYPSATPKNDDVLVVTVFPL